MLTLRRLTRTLIVLTLVMDFIVFGTFAETMTSYSGQYALDLEQKQILLESIREDAYNTERDRLPHDRGSSGELSSARSED